MGLRTLKKNFKQAFEAISLTELKKGENAEIESIDQDHPFRERFLELGFTTGSSIKILRKALLGDPIVIQVRNSHFALRKTDAKSIKIKKQSLS